MIVLSKPGYIDTSARLTILLTYFYSFIFYCALGNLWHLYKFLNISYLSSLYLLTKKTWVKQMISTSLSLQVLWQVVSKSCIILTFWNSYTCVILTTWVWPAHSDLFLTNRMWQKQWDIISKNSYNHDFHHKHSSLHILWEANSHAMIGPMEKIT
jgi:hypothetical protein